MRCPLLRDNRGVSEIIGSLILVFIVSVAGVIVYSYSLNTFNSSSSYFRLNTGAKEERARERLTVVAVWWNSANQLNLTVLNYGKVQSAIDDVYFNGTRVSNFLSGKGTTTGVGEMIRIKFTSPVAIVPDCTYEIVVVSQRGTANAVYWKA